MFRRKEEEMENTSNTSSTISNENTLSIANDTTTSSSEADKKVTGSAANYRAATQTPSTPQSSNSQPTGGSNVTDITRGRFEARPATTTPATSTTSEKPVVSPKSSSNRVLTVGNDILMKGEITTCDRLVIEGAVDATLKDVHTMEIAETGSFKGVADVKEAEISGSVEGTLNVSGRLIVYASGKVNGNITYGEIEIERGGQLTGEVKSTATASGAQKKAA